MQEKLQSHLTTMCAMVIFLLTVLHWLLVLVSVFQLLSVAAAVALQSAVAAVAANSALLAVVATLATFAVITQTIHKQFTHNLKTATVQHTINHKQLQLLSYRRCTLRHNQFNHLNNMLSCTQHYQTNNKLTVYTHSFVCKPPKQFKNAQ